MNMNQEVCLLDQEKQKKTNSSRDICNHFISAFCFRITYRTPYPLKYRELVKSIRRYDSTHSSYLQSLRRKVAQNTAVAKRQKLMQTTEKTGEWGAEKIG